MVFINSILLKHEAIGNHYTLPPASCGVREGTRTSGDLTVVRHSASIPTEQPLLHGEGQGWHI